MADMIRVVRRRRTTTVPNELVTDWRLSLKSKGLMLVLLSRPSNWKFKVSGLAAFCHCGRDAIRTSLLEMEAAGYLERKRTRAEGGKFAGNEYIVYDVSQLDADEKTEPEGPLATGFSEPPPLSGNPTMDEGQPLSGFPALDKPASGEPALENPPPDPSIRTGIEDTPPTPQKGGRKPRRPKEEPEPDWLPERFERFWQYYPKNYRGNKQKARSAWNKLKPDNTVLRAMANAIARHKEGERWKEGVGIPNASTFINPANGYWDMDDAAAAPEAPGNESGRGGVMVVTDLEKL